MCQNLNKISMGLSLTLKFFVFIPATINTRRYHSWVLINSLPPHNILESEAWNHDLCKMNNFSPVNKGLKVSCDKNLREGDKISNEAIAQGGRYFSAVACVMRHTQAPGQLLAPGARYQHIEAEEGLVMAAFSLPRVFLYLWPSRYRREKFLSHRNVTKFNFKYQILWKENKR